MYVNRGMIEAARTEGEMAGVMAHEISHVALRHGTAQATKGQKYGYVGRHCRHRWSDPGWSGSGPVGPGAFCGLHAEVQSRV